MKKPNIILIMATCCDVAGIEYPRQYEGREITPLEGLSLLPILRGREREPHKLLYWEHYGNRAVRQSKWKLVEDAKAGRWELYDMEKDRTELHDLLDELPERTEALKKCYSEWAEHIGL